MRVDSPLDVKPVVMGVCSCGWCFDGDSCDSCTGDLCDGTEYWLR